LPNNSELIHHYLQEATAAEKAFEEQLRSFATEGDDEEVQSAFAEHADETRSQYDRLKTRLTALGAEESQTKSLLTSLPDSAPKFAQAGENIEERLVQNLITAFSVENAECAMYEALATIARADGDELTEKLAREIQAEEQRAAEKIFHFLPTRSKIAFNMLTLDEIDLAVETKAAENRIV
jgi:ferritin-like metal-binding protein YciE